MYELKKTSPINNMKSIQYIFCVECEDTVERESVSEMEDNSVQLELMNPFYEVKCEKPSDVSFDMDEKGGCFLIRILFVNIVILIKLQNMVIMLGI